jgi:hypothetical protein
MRILTILVLLVAIAKSGFTQSTPEATKAWTLYSDAQRAWQQSLAEFLSRRRPDLKAIIALSRDLQLAMIDRRSIEFRYLLDAHPNRIIKNKGISTFANFDWDSQDETALRRLKTEFVRAGQLVQDLQQRNNNHPQWPLLREAHQSLAKETEYGDLYQRFQQEVKNAEEVLIRVR